MRIVLFQCRPGFSAGEEGKHQHITPTNKTVAKKAARKALQRKRKAAAKSKADRHATLSGDKSFGAAILKTYPHMEWNGTELSPSQPAPSP